MRIDDDVSGAHAAFRQLGELGIDEAGVFRELEEEGVRKFTESYDAVLQSIQERLKVLTPA